jgi:D-glycero-alpha-D-manno-heptose-7-phosphate kinase
MMVKSTAPMRVDLAGGTLDIYPLYLFTEGGLTVNAAITLMSEVTIETRDDLRVHIVADDLGEEMSAPDAGSLELGGKLDLLARLVKFYDPPCGVNVHTKNDVPKGSGLGASSSLLIALSHALNRLLDDRHSAEDIINFGANLEAQTIRIPTGKQDYYSATYGGISVIWFDVRGARREELVKSNSILAALEERLVITFAGEPRASATSNWKMYRNYVDGEARTVHNIQQIKQTALAMKQALSKGNLDVFGQLLAEEWENRKGLADGVSNDEIEAMMAAAKKAGAVSNKICGAGGGGSMISFCEPGTKQSVEKALRDAGAMVYGCGIARRGVEVTVS